MKNTFISILTLMVSGIFAKDAFFGDVKRAEIFEKTDFVVPKITINLSEKDYRNLFLKYQCERDMNVRYLNKNEDCYQASWMNYDKIMKKAIEKNLIDSSLIKDSKDLELLSHTNKTFSDFENIVSKYSNYTIDKILSTGYGLYKIPDYETEEETGLSFDINGEVTKVPSIHFSVGGKYTRNFEKLGYNIKIKKGELFERKQLRLRSEAVDPSFLREKLAYDICNLVELPSLSSNFAKVFLNNKFMGLFAMRDAFKAHWVEYYFGEKSTKHLYTCDRNYGSNKFFNCVNDNDEITDDTEFKKFQNRLEKAKTREELEKFFDVETFMRWQALKYLMGSWDHTTNDHNQCLYMFHDTSSGNDMWIPLLYDFDSEFGAYMDSNPRRTFNREIYDSNNPLFKILNLKDDNKELMGYVEEYMRKAFNPKKLIPRIDELKKFLDPYVKEDRTPDDDGNLPGRLKRVNIKIEDYFTYEEFLSNTEYTDIKLRKYTSDTTYNEDRILGLKRWMVERFKFICENYGFDCSYAQEYLGEPNYKVETRLLEEKNGGCRNSGYNCCLFSTSVITTDNVGKWGIENDEWCLFESTEDDSCWSTKLGYKCCTLRTTKPIYYSKSADKWYGVENDEWCGIIDLQLCPSGGQYNCCEECNVVYTDSEDWGIENGKWCSIPYSCKEQDQNNTTTTTTTTTTASTTTTTITSTITTTTTTTIPQTTTSTTTTTTTPTTILQTTTTSTTTPTTPTTTIPPTTTNATDFQNSTDPNVQCGKAFEMCGGTLFPEAPNCCEPGNICVKKYDTYHQCLPDYLITTTAAKTTPTPTTTIAQTTTTTTTSTTTAATTTTPQNEDPNTTSKPYIVTPISFDGECALKYSPCGGENFPEITTNCCEEGSSCLAHNQYYYQCIPDDQLQYYIDVNA
jgi:hypothetical protein